MKIPRQDYENLVRDSETLRSVESLILDDSLPIPEEPRRILLAVLGRVSTGEAERVYQRLATPGELREPSKATTREVERPEEEVYPDSQLKPPDSPLKPKRRGRPSTGGK